MIKIRVYFLSSLFAVASMLLVYRAFQLQIIPSRNVEKLAQRQLHKTISIVGRRGNLRDRNGQDLAVSTNSLSIYINPHRVKDAGYLSKKLGWVLGVSPHHIRGQLKKFRKRKFAWLQRQLDSKQLARLQSLDLKTLEGVGVLPEFRRVYPYGNAGSHLLGFVSIDGKGLAGVEAAYESRLTGESKKVIVQRDAKGRPIFSHLEQLRLEDTKGEDLQLTIDVNFQSRIESLLSRSVKFHEADSALAIVMEAKSGEILALALSPGYDPNNPGRSSAGQRRNRVTSDPVEPGSVVKSFLVARALEDGLVSPSSEISAGGGKIKIGRKTITESDSNHVFDKLSVTDLIRFSSNVATVNLQKLMGFSRVEDTFRKVGLFEKTGIEIYGESRGIYRAPTQKQKLEQATISYGHGIAVTPMQILKSYSVFANNGFLVQPRIFKSQNESSKQESMRIFSQKTVSQMKQILKGVVEKGGTGEPAKIAGYDAAGKTGTALKTKTDGRGYVAGAYLSSFVGFFPADQAEIVVYVMVDNPRVNGKYASKVAAPLFADITTSYLSIVHGYRGDVVAQESIFRRRAQEKHDTSTDALPSMRGMNIVHALKYLEGRPIRVEVLGTGEVVENQHFKKASTKGKPDTVELRVR